MIRYLVVGLLGATICGVAGAIVLPLLAFKFAMETIAIMMAGSGLMAPLAVVLIGAIAGAAIGLIGGLGIMLILDGRRDRTKASASSTSAT